MPQITNPIPGAPIRARDPQGGGHFGAGRGNRQHLGVDIEAAPGTAVVAPVSGTILTVNAEPYSDPERRGRYRIVDILTDDGHVARVFYVAPAHGLEPGHRVERGQTQIGQAQNLHEIYDRSMTNHIHLELLRRHTVPPAEDGSLAARDPMQVHVDPTPYIRGN